MAYHVGMVHEPTTHNLPGYDEALVQVLASIEALEPEPVPLASALGCVLAEPILADRDQPPFNRSTMDGYAVRSSKVNNKVVFNVLASVSAGSELDASLNYGDGVVAIATGASVPDAFDAVIPLEQAEERDGKVRFEVDRVNAGAFIHVSGSDARCGDVLIETGRVLTPQHIGIAAAVGCVMPIVYRKPGVSLISTGDEVRPAATATESLAPQQIRNANGPMLDALLHELNVERLDHVHVCDDKEATLSALREAVDKSDLVLSVGGVSAGARDFVPWAIKELGFETIIKGAAIQPGKPVLIAKQKNETGALFIGLPGNPVSVLATFHLFAWPIILKLSGMDASLAWDKVSLTETVKPNPNREAFRCAQLAKDCPGKARVIGWQNSGDLAHTANADGFVRLPKKKMIVNEGEVVPFLRMIGRGVCK